VHLELLEPTDPDSPIAKFLEKNPPEGIHHVAFGTDDIAGPAQAGRGAGVRLIHESPSMARAASWSPSCIRNPPGVLTEFCAQARRDERPLTRRPLPWPFHLPCWTNSMPAADCARRRRRRQAEGAARKRA
jgi:hypothetical protein